MDQAEPLDPELERAFNALVEVSARLISEGRAPRAAAVKVALQRHLGQFAEKQFGFSTFRLFLQAAAQTGRVQLKPAPHGPDVDVVPTGVELPAPTRSGNRLRRDVWDAFTRWDEGFLRFWDREQARAFRIPERPDTAEAQEHAALRSAFQANDPRLVPIEHVPVDALIEWAREFANTLPPDPTRSALLAALDHDLPIHNFTQLVRRLGFGTRWHDAHVARVRHVVDQWAKANKLEIDLTRDVQTPIGHDRRAEQSPVTRAQFTVTEDDLRRRVHEMVDEMTLPELLGLAVPLRLVIHTR